MEEFNKFLYPSRVLFNNGFEGGILQFWRFPGKNNHKMQRQHACFLYDTLNYEIMNLKGFEDFVNNISEPEDGKTTLTKIHLKMSWIGDVLKRLEMMGIESAACCF